jgi:hypothetical protein
VPPWPIARPNCQSSGESLVPPAGFAENGCNQCAKK